jgi:hypothetical protein
LICTYLIESVLLLITTYSTPLRLELPLFTTPANVIVLREPIDNISDFFVTFPGIEIIGDSIFFRDLKALILKDGVPVSSLADVDFPSIERIEVLGEDASSLYGNAGGVINVVTKTFNYDIPYSKITLTRYLGDTLKGRKEYEFGSNLGKSFDVYVTGDVEKETFNGNIGYRKKFADIRLYFGKDFALKGNLFSRYKFVLAEDYFMASSTFKFKNHTALLGFDTHDKISLFVQDYFMLSPILFIVPSVRYGAKFNPKLSFGYIPKLNFIAFGSITRDEINLGARYKENAIALYRKDGVFGINTTFASPWIKGVRLMGGLSNKDPSLRFDYKASFRDGNLDLYVLADSRKMARIELRVIDVRLWARVETDSYPSVGLSWEFWD